MLKKIGDIDNKVIYALLLVALVTAMLYPVGLAIVPSQETWQVVQFLDSLPSDAIIYVGMEFGAVSIPEHMPALQAVIRYGFHKGFRFIAGGMLQEAGELGERAFSIVPTEFPDKEYGKDWINLGYRAGNDVLLQRMLVDFDDAVLGVDYKGDKISTMPLMAEVKTAHDFDAALSMTGGKPGHNEYIKHWVAPNNIPLLVSCTSVETSSVMPLIQSKLVSGGILGMAGAAELEVALGMPGMAATGMDAQSFTHLLIVLFIVFGNIGYFAHKRGSAAEALGAAKQGGGKA